MMSEFEEVRCPKRNDHLPLCYRLTEDSPLATIFAEGPSHLVRYANPAFCRIIGKAAGTMVGRPFAEAVPEEAQTACAALLDRVYQSGQAQTLADQKHFPSSPTPTYWSYTAWAIREEEEPPSGVIVQVSDTTQATLLRHQWEKTSQEVKEVNQQLLIAALREQELAEAAAVAKQELHQAQKMEGIGRLAGGIAHDFNNLLTAILGFTELAGETLQPDDEVQSYLHNIHKAAERATTLTAQLLAFARKQIIAPKVVDINALIQDVDKMLSRLIGEHIELSIVPSPEAGQVKIDPGQFGQVLINLVVNARDAMPEGGKITLKTANVIVEEDKPHQHPRVGPGDYAVLSVSDTGTGIPEELLDHLFEPFFTTKGQGKGTGLGLATCYGIVAQSGGHIHVESKIGKGTVFTIYLPRMQETVIPIKREDLTGVPQGSETLFLVEDEPLVRYIGATGLRHLGYTVLEAENGVDALLLVDRYTDVIDLLITDVVMPQMGGRELAERFREIRPDVPVIYTSGYTDTAIVHEGVLEPGLAFLQKPFTPAALAHKVREVLDGTE